MSSEYMKLDYEAVEIAMRSFAQATETLQNIRQETLVIALMIADGALRGRGGATFVSILEEDVSPSIFRLSERFEELHQDLKTVIDLMRVADQTSQQQFTNGL